MTLTLSYEETIHISYVYKPYWLQDRSWFSPTESKWSFQFLCFVYVGHWPGTVYQIRQPFWSLFHTKYLLCVYLIETFLFLCTVACKSDIQNSFVFTFLSKHKGVPVSTTSFYCASFVLFWERQTRIQQAIILFLQVKAKFHWS